MHRTCNSQNNYENTKVGGLRLPNFKTCYKATVVKKKKKKKWYLCKDRYMDQYNKIENTGIGPHIYVNWLSEKLPSQFKGGGGEKVFSTNDSATTEYLIEKHKPWSLPHIVHKI